MSQKYKTRLILVVHDEICCETYKTEKHIMPKLRWLMSDFKTFRVPITAGLEIGKPSWGQKEDCEVTFEPLTEKELNDIAQFDFYDGSVFNKDLYDTCNAM
jgi:hypothetical protein